eukprot:6282639-Prymnesium_polylepis.1
MDRKKRLHETADIVQGWGGCAARKLRSALVNILRARTPQKLAKFNSGPPANLAESVCVTKVSSRDLT